MAPPPKFRPLTEMLCALPPDVRAVRVTFRELEAMVGGSLPRGAWTRGYWQGGTVARNNWLRCGFAARFDRHRQTVLFTRLSEPAVSHAPFAAPAAQQLAPAAHQLAMGALQPAS